VARVSSGKPHDNGDNVLVRFLEVRAETGSALLLRVSEDDAEDAWIPKSQIAHIDLDANEVWIPLWLAEKKGLEYA
jgi:hypothetical protein